MIQTLKQERRIESDRMLRSLDSEYSILSRHGTTEFIKRHPRVSAALLALIPHVEAYFGHSLPTVEAICDPEESSEKLRVQIVTSMPPMKAMQTLDVVEHVWLDRMNPAIAELFILTVAPK